MRNPSNFQKPGSVLLMTGLLLAACGSPMQAVPATNPPEPVNTEPSAVPPTAEETKATSPEWFSVEMVNVNTGEVFTIQDLSGKVILVETIATWCPTCVSQQTELKKMREALGNPENLVLVSLNVDMGEDETLLKEYAANQDFDWYVAVAPLTVSRALGNLYSAQYLNPPLAPMLLIDREGNVMGLPFGVKSAESLQMTVEPYLVP